MSKGWKRVGRYAEREAYSSEDVEVKVRNALSEDFKTGVPEAVLKAALETFKETARGLFGISASDFESLEHPASSSTLGHAFVDQCKQVADSGIMGDAGYNEAVRRTLEDLGERHVRQMREHYLRESSKSFTNRVVNRVAVAISNVIQTTNAIISDKGSVNKNIRTKKQTGAYDGFAL
jgi:hypothetical protein